ncbi:MAG: hypothetical protein L3K06_05345 [Thermoplasmata archaeon]|nr:hypothetical protein [Thermoplasmata archaeon]
MSETDRANGAPIAPLPPLTDTAVIVAGGEETRVLLRGLLRLQHFRVVGESEGSTDGLQLVRQHRPGLVLIETNLAEGSALSLLHGIREFLPRSRLVVIGALDREGGPVPDGTADALLKKPFRIAEFAKAIGREESPARPA